MGRFRLHHLPPLWNAVNQSYRAIESEYAEYREEGPPRTYPRGKPDELAGPADEVEPRPKNPVQFPLYGVKTRRSPLLWPRTCGQEDGEESGYWRKPMRRLVTALFVFALVGLCSASRAQADEVFTWTLPASPTIAPGNVDLGGFIEFTIPGVSFSENGVSQSGVFDFFNSISGGGFDLGAAPLCTATGTCILDEGGAQLYTGTESAPTFVPGTYSLTGFPDSPNPGGTGTLTITAGPNGDLFTFSTVPEPASLLLMGVGALSFLGFARKKILA